MLIFKVKAPSLPTPAQAGWYFSFGFASSKCFLPYSGRLNSKVFKLKYHFAHTWLVSFVRPNTCDFRKVYNNVNFFFLHTLHIDLNLDSEELQDSKTGADVLLQFFLISVRPFAKHGTAVAK